MTRSLVLLSVALVALGCCATVVSAQCNADMSVSTGQGGSGGALLANGGWSTNTGQCIDAKDNFARCNNNGVDPRGRCGTGQLCCANAYVRALANAYTPVKQYAAGVCFLDKDRNTGAFPQGKCVKDQAKECDSVGRYKDFTDVAKYFPQYNCPGSKGCCEYLKGEFDAQNKKISDAAAAKRAAQKAIDDKAAALAAANAVAQKTAATAAANAGLAARLAAAKARPVKSFLECNFFDQSGNHPGSCVQDSVECPGATASPVKLRENHAMCTAAKTGVAHCCQSDARFPGVEQLERSRRIVAEKMVTEDRIKRAAAAAVATAAPIFAKYPAPIACVGFPKNIETKGTCAISADSCIGANANWGSIQDVQLTCGKYKNIVASINDPVCCFGTVKGGAPVVGASAPTSVSADAAMKAAQVGCSFSYLGSSLKGYCSPSEDLCAGDGRYGMTKFNEVDRKACDAFGASSVCCASDTAPPAADVATTVCPMPSYTSFLEIETEVDADTDSDMDAEAEAEMDAEIEAELDAESDMEIDAEDDSSPIGRTARAARFLQRTTAPKKTVAAKKPTAAAKKVDSKSSTKGKAPAKKTASPAAQKAHCAAERRAWLAGKAKKGDQKAITELLRLGKGKPKRTKAASKATPVKSAAAAKKPVAKKATAKKARFAELEPLGA